MLLLTSRGEGARSEGHRGCSRGARYLDREKTFSATRAGSKTDICFSLRGTATKVSIRTLWALPSSILRQLTCVGASRRAVTGVPLSTPSMNRRGVIL
ncbi:hypothetical protein ElyMa_002979800 [Elysia marginata]|uniref:Uncharacterized protein n=1 Tax=Elysia marginata TaxID=1093978 RepID=A0AAV4I9C6_9GAST|nr:hypothetical protein ElyMa_002979800 [Elysia marginata]